MTERQQPRELEPLYLDPPMPGYGSQPHLEAAPEHLISVRRNAENDEIGWAIWKFGLVVVTVIAGYPDPNGTAYSMVEANALTGASLGGSRGTLTSSEAAARLTEYQRVSAALDRDPETKEWR